MLNIRSKTRNNILNYFFLNEDKGLYINEIARLISADPKNVYRMLISLEKEGLLTSEFKGKERYFYANKKSPFYKGYRDIFLKTAGIEAILKDTIKLVPGIKEAYIFGSYAGRHYGPESDIDILLVGTHSPLRVQRALHKIQRHIGREINTVNITPQELKKKLKSNSRFIKAIFSHKAIKLL